MVPGVAVIAGDGSTAVPSAVAIGAGFLVLVTGAVVVAGSGYAFSAEIIGT